jgi:hypothetical protein
LLLLPDENFINITPFPFFTRFKRSYNWMSRRFKMLCPVFIYRRIATSYVTTR